MQFLKITPRQIPRLLFAHKFSTSHYENRLKTENTIEISHIDKGAIFASVNGKSYAVAENEFVIVPPHSLVQTKMQAEGAFHAHSTACFTIDGDFEFLSEKEVYSCCFLPEGLLPRPAQNFFVLPVVFHETDRHVLNRLLEIISARGAESVASCYGASGLFLQMCQGITQRALEMAQTHGPAFAPPSNLLYCQKVADFVDVHYQEPITLALLSQVAGVNKSYLCRVFKSTLQMTPLGYVTRVRLGKAKALLTATNKTTAQIAEEVGIVNEEYFRKLFKKYEGVTPGYFRAFSLR